VSILTQPLEYVRTHNVPLKTKIEKKQKAYIATDEATKKSQEDVPACLDALAKQSKWRGKPTESRVGKQNPTEQRTHACVKITHK